MSSRTLLRFGGILRPRLAASSLGRAAALTGAATVGASAVAFCDSPSAPAVPKFVLGGDQYDQNTFQGRLTKIQELIDMRTLLITDEEVAASQKLLAEFKAKGSLPDGVSDAQMWSAQRTVNAVIHAPTGEKMNIFGCVRPPPSHVLWTTPPSSLFVALPSTTANPISVGSTPDSAGVCRCSYRRTCQLPRAC